MPANNEPIYTNKPDLSSNNGTGFAPAFTLAQNTYTGAGANDALIHTAGANGSYIRKLRLKPIGTNVASVLRLYLNNGLVNTTAANNNFYGEVYLPATTISAILPLVDLEYPLDIGLTANYRLFAGLATAVAAGWVVTVVSGQY